MRYTDQMAASHDLGSKIHAAEVAGLSRVLRNEGRMTVYGKGGATEYGTIRAEYFEHEADRMLVAARGADMRRRRCAILAP